MSLDLVEARCKDVDEATKKLVEAVGEIFGVSRETPLSKYPEAYKAACRLDDVRSQLTSTIRAGTGCDWKEA